MGILKQIQEQDERNTTTEILPDLISRLDSVEQHLSKLTKHISDQTAYIKSIDENTTAQLESLLISHPGEQHSTEFVEMRNRLSEIEKTIAAVAETLTASRHVTLPDGTTIRSADFQAYNLTQRINNQLKTMVSSCDHLAKEVRQRGTVRINTDKLTQHCLDVLDRQLAAAVKGPLQRVEHRLDGLEGRVSSLGAKEISRAVGEVERVTTKTDELMEAIRDAELRIDRLSGRVAWVSAGRICLALLPLAVVLLVIGGLTMGAFHALGMGPLLGWAWASFAAAQAWWAKALIALGTLICVAAFAWLVWWISHRLADEYARW